METLCCPLQLLRWVPRETEAFLAPIAAYCTPPHHLNLGWTGLEVCPRLAAYQQESSGLHPTVP